MTKKEIKILVKGAYVNGALDVKKVRRVAKLLKQSELRQFIKVLKRFEESKMVRLIVPNKDMVSQNIINKVKADFPRKRVVIDEDPELIIGVKIIDNDLIYELNIKNTLDQLNKHIIEQYDN